MFTLTNIAELPAAFSAPSWLRPTDPVLLHTGDLALDGDLLLDWSAGWEDGRIAAALAGLQGQAVSGLCVHGDLHLAGALVNADGDSGPLLLVTGVLGARQASCGGSHIRVDGDLRVQEVVYGHYNHGQLIVGGQVIAQALVNDDHGIDVRGRPAKGSKLLRIDLSEGRDPDDPEILPAALRKLLKKSPLSLESVRDGLRQGRSLASMATPQTAEEWRNVVWRDYTRIAKIPKELRTEAMYPALLAPQCPLPRPEVHELFSRIPPRELTPGVRQAAFALAPKSLLMLPPKFDLQQEYEACFLALGDPQAVVAEIPTQFMSPAMADHLAARSGKP